MADLPGLSEAIEAGDRDGAVQLTAAAIAEGVTPQAILDAMTDAMDAVGEDLQANLIFVPEMLVAARAMREAMALLEPILVKAGIQPEARAIIGTVGPGGGYLLAAHTIMNEVPPENVLAMVDAAVELGTYPIRG